MEAPPGFKQKSRSKSRWELHENATFCFEQILEAATHKTAVAQSPTSDLTIYVRQRRHARQCWRSKNDFICDVLLYTPSHTRGRVFWPAKTNIHQLRGNTGGNREDQPEAVDDIYIEREIDRERERERESGHWAISTIYLSVYLSQITYFYISICQNNFFQ